MTSIDAADNTTAQSVPLVPHYPNKELIQFSGNDAEIPGIMHEIKLYLIRMDLHQPLLSDRACLVSGGKTAVDSVQAIPFLMGNLIDIRGFDDPAPPSPAARAQPASPACIKAPVRWRRTWKPRRGL